MYSHDTPATMLLGIGKGILAFFILTGVCLIMTIHWMSLATKLSSVCWPLKCYRKSVWIKDTHENRMFLQQSKVVM